MRRYLNIACVVSACLTMLAALFLAASYFVMMTTSDFLTAFLIYAAVSLLSKPMLLVFILTIILWAERAMHIICTIYHDKNKKLITNMDNRTE